MARDTDRLLEHEADGIREFDNQLPRWWLYGFYFTIAFSVLYMVNYHVLETPLVGHKGMVAEYEAEMEAASRLAAGRPAAPATATGLVALTDAGSLSQGEALYNSATSLCSSCHRPDLGGLVGPDLTDDKWLHGCTVSDVVTSIRAGYPTRGMLPYGSNTPLNDEQLLQLASYVLSKRGSAPPSPKAADPERDVVCP